ncbi:Putative transcriptional accessory protein [Escherichia coli P12b]|nr:Putative transcriptional accessory protein [Escherichia coli P12b]
MMNDSFCRIIAGEIQARPEQVDAAVRLLDEGIPCRLSHVIVRKSPAVWMTRSCVIWKRV